MVVPDRGIRQNVRLRRFGTPPGSPNPLHWYREVSWSMRHRMDRQWRMCWRSPKTMNSSSCTPARRRWQMMSSVPKPSKRKTQPRRSGFIGAHVAVLPEPTLRDHAVIDFVCRHEFDYTCKELAEGKPWDEIRGLSYRDANGNIHHTPDRDLIHDWDAMPSVLPTYARDLDITKYFIGYLLHPYVSFYTGRGCPAKCSFCLWPQTIGGHQYRTKSPEAVGRELDEAKAIFGDRVREYMFDDDTFTIDKQRAIAISEHMKRLKLTWSCNARANLDYNTLKQLRDNGLRLLLVGFESGNQQILDNINKGIKLEAARLFMKHCRDLGITVHGTFMIGLPIETRETIDETIRFACELSPHTIQVSIAAPYPGTELYAQAKANGWFTDQALVASSGMQTSTLQYPGLSNGAIEDAVEQMYRRFYFRPKAILPIVREMLTDRQMLVRRLREGGEFFAYLKERRTQAIAHTEAKQPLQV